jgi:hypothetical protein
MGVRVRSCRREPSRDLADHSVYRMALSGGISEWYFVRPTVDPFVAVSAIAEHIQDKDL